jgi:glycosyltransferase involved in cell wall biosynthesis
MVLVKVDLGMQFSDSLKIPVVSISCLAYNHAPYIKTCLDGFLMQKTSFAFEIIIHDDASTDGTKEIIEEYATKYPDIIFPICQKENQYSKGVKPTWAFNAPRWRGKYIALCEGDDYWTDQLKLQKQVDILEANPHLVGCFHNSEERYWNDYSKASSLYLSLPGGREVSIQELTQYNMVPTASIVFKKPIPDELFTDEFLNLAIGDWPLHLLNTRNGNYYYLPQVMSVRNLNPQSAWGMQDHYKNVAKVVRTYNVLIDSGWFTKAVIDLLKIGRENLENSIKPKKAMPKVGLKGRIINKIIRVLNKIK